MVRENWRTVRKIWRIVGENWRMVQDIGQRDTAASEGVPFLSSHFADAVPNPAC
jgi:Tfp pilus assembly protein PilW